jgi:hypothetical protein
MAAAVSTHKKPAATATGSAAVEADKKKENALYTADQIDPKIKAQHIQRHEMGISLFSALYRKLTAAIVEKIVAIAQDNFDRMNGVTDSPLLCGYHYATRYFEELEKRGEVAQANMESMRKNDVFYKGKAPSALFVMKSNNEEVSGVYPFNYIVKKRQSASDALDSLGQLPTFIGCGEAALIARATAIRSVLGKDKFDALFGLDAVHRLIIGTDDHLIIYNPLYQLITAIFPADISKVKVGDMVCIQGAKGYLDKHIVGSSQAFNVICIEAETGKEPKFTGLGLDPKGVTLAQIVELLWKNYNANSIDPVKLFNEKITKVLFKVPDSRKTFDRLHKHQISLAKFKEDGGGVIVEGASTSFDVMRIATLQMQTIPEAQKWLKEWHESYIKAYEDGEKAKTAPLKGNAAPATTAAGK